MCFLPLCHGNAAFCFPLLLLDLVGFGATLQRAGQEPHAANGSGAWVWKSVSAAGFSRVFPSVREAAALASSLSAFCLPHPVCSPGLVPSFCFLQKTGGYEREEKTQASAEAFAMSRHYFMGKALGTDSDHLRGSELKLLSQVWEGVWPPQVNRSKTRNKYISLCSTHSFHCNDLFSPRISKAFNVLALREW